VLLFCLMAYIWPHMHKRKAVIIGAGIAGIATAIRMAVKGYQVEVFEANSYPGGKLTEINKDGYRFDAGPSLFTMPQYVDELFELAGVSARAAFNYQKLDTVCKYFYQDGTVINAFADAEKFAREADNLTEKNDAIPAFFKKSQKIYQVTNHVFLERSLHRLKTYFRLATLKSILNIFAIDAFRSMHKANTRFFTNQHLVQLFDRYATYNGSNPYRAPATLNVIQHLEQHFGAYFPDGGMHSITTSLVKLATQLGVNFNYNMPVDEILITDKLTTGIKVGGQPIPADIVISNMDVWFTYKKLLKAHPKLQPTKTLRQQRSSSALIFYWGIKKEFNELDVHNIFFSANYQTEFDAIWKEKAIHADPTVYINISSKLKPDDAPAGCENWFVMINVPSNSGQDWDVLIAAARANILKKLSGILKFDIPGLIQTEVVLDPRGIESKTSSYQGSLYGTSSNNKFAAFLRHSNRQSKIKNLYFCGGSVHPGGGIPLALLSAKIVSDWID
jgi:phytoene desaturase